jgi:hypothetical protein
LVSREILRQAQGRCDRDRVLVSVGKPQAGILSLLWSCDTEAVNAPVDAEAELGKQTVSPTARPACQ